MEHFYNLIIISFLRIKHFFRSFTQDARTVFGTGAVGISSLWNTSGLKNIFNWSVFLFFSALLIRCGSFRDEGTTIFSDNILIQHRPIRLKDNVVQCAYKSPTQEYWFGTAEGLLRFDGQTWTGYSTADGLPGQDIRAIAGGEDGSLWIGTEMGLCQFKNNFTALSDPLLFEKQIIALARWGDSLLIGSTEGFFIYRFSNQQVLKPSLPTQDQGLTNIRVIEVVPPKIILGTYAGILYYEPKSGWRLCQEQNGLPSNIIYAIQFDTQRGQVWMGTAAGLCFADTQFQSFHSIDSSRGFPNSLVTSLVLKGPTLWAGTLEGLVRLNINDLSLQTLEIRQGLAHNTIKSLFADESFIWIGHILNGITRYKIKGG